MPQNQEDPTIPAADPFDAQQTIQVQNLKALGELTNAMVESYNNVALNTSQNFSATMDAINKQMVNNLDFANKIMGTRLEVDPVEAAATSVVLQQAAKTAQSTPPVTP